jgi:hypothetical protein
MRVPNARTSMDWDKLKVFHAAAEAGSFTHAGEQLGLSQSAVSRQVSALRCSIVMHADSFSPSRASFFTVPPTTCS